MLKVNSQLKSTCKWFPVCPIKFYTEAGVLDPKWVDQYCLMGHHNCVRYEMEEKGEVHPDNMLPDGSIQHDLS